MTTLNRERLHAAARNSRREWFSISAKAEQAEASEATIHIYAEIGDSF